MTSNKLASSNGGRTRTDDTEHMKLVSYQLLYPAMYCKFIYSLKILTCQAYSKKKSTILRRLTWT